MVGADVEHAADGDKGEPGVHVVLVYCLKGAAAQQAPAPGGRGEVAYKLRAALRAVALAQGLHSLAVGPVQL